MTSEIVRDRDLCDLIEHVEESFDAWEEVLESYNVSDGLRRVGDDVHCTLGSTAEYLLQLRDERLRVKVSA